MIAEQTRIPPDYTDDVPVLTKELLTSFRHDRRYAQSSDFRAAVDRIHLSETPDIFSHLTDMKHSVAVWRRPQPPVIAQFIACAMEVLDHPLYEDLPSYLCLNDKGLLAYPMGREIDLDDIASPFTDAEIPQEFCTTFATYFMDSLIGVLKNLPAGTALQNFTSEENAFYKVGRSFPHMDGDHAIILHGSDPGTPYMLFNDKHDHAKPIEADYRTQIGDVTFHGDAVAHALATSCPTAPNKRKARFCAIYVVKLNP